MTERFVVVLFSWVLMLDRTLKLTGSGLVSLWGVTGYAWLLMVTALLVLLLLLLLVWTNRGGGACCTEGARMSLLPAAMRSG